MPTTSDLFHLAAEYHRALPERIRKYLHSRGIPDEIVNRHFLGWNGSRITIPVFNRKGICAFFRLGKDPDDESRSPKMLSSRGSHIDLDGWELLRLQPKRVISVRANSTAWCSKPTDSRPLRRPAAPARSRKSGLRHS